MTASSPVLTNKIFNATVLVTALGYFIDLFDYYIFLATRVQVLTDFGYSGAALTEAGLFLVNMQFAGMLVGGLFFGILGDKLGRKQSLMGSILIYSLATLFSGLTYNLDVFTALRFLAGFGIAGEVGVAVTLISETMSKEKRNLGVTIMASFGVLGVVAAGVAAEMVDWRTCYIAGGVAGLMLLVTRALVMNSPMFARLEGATPRGDLRLLWRNKEYLKRYLLCILVASPVFWGVAIVMVLSPELAKALGVGDPVRASVAMIVGYTLMTVGEIVVGGASQKLQSRKRVMHYALMALGFTVIIGFNITGYTATAYYALVGVVGMLMGYWVNFIALSAEQFGTNFRATAATSIPNFARGMVIPINLAFLYLKEQGVVFATITVGLVCIALALLALRYMPETFGKDLDYTE